MRKSLLSFAFILFFILSCAFYGVPDTFLLAETQLGEIVRSIQELDKEDENYEKKIYQLFYDGQTLIDSGIGEDDEIQSFQLAKKEYYKQKAIEKVISACNDDYMRVVIDGDAYLFYQAQYESVISYRQEFLEKVEIDEDYEKLQKEFFDKVSALPTVSAITFERESYILQYVDLMINSIFDKVNDSLSARGYSIFQTRPNFNDDDFEQEFHDLLVSSYYSDQVSAITQDFQQAVNTLNDSPIDWDKSQLEQVAQDFESKLASYQGRTATYQSGLLEVARLAAIERLESYLTSGEYSKPYLDKISLIVESAKQKISAATSVESLATTLEQAEKEISSIEIKNYDWVGLLVLAIVLFMLFGLAAFVFFKLKERKKGIQKYENLLEDERERIEGEIKKALRENESQDNP